MSYCLFIFVFILSTGCATNENSNPLPTLSSDISLTLSVSNTSPEIGSNVTFTLLVSNEGPDLSRDIEVEAILPDGYSYLEDNSANTYDQSTGKWSIDEIAARASARARSTA